MLTRSFSATTQNLWRILLFVVCTQLLSRHEKLTDSTNVR